jgi:hypothetical protein
VTIGWLIIIFAIIAVALGSVIALVWWHLADVLFPGTAEKTGQRIFRRRREREPRQDAVVIDYSKSPPRAGESERSKASGEHEGLS